MKKNIIGIIGGGNMGEALVKGLIAEYQVHVCENSVPRVKYLKEKYPQIIMKAFESIKASSVLILGVKPQDMEAAFLWVSTDDSRKDKLFISIAAGLPTEYFEKHLKNSVFCPEPRVVRAMPNMPALINEGMTGICKGQFATDEDLKTAEEILNAIGQTVTIKEEMMDALTAVSGSGPAYVFLFVEKWIAAAITLGFNEEQAKHLVLGTLIGSARLLEKSEFNAATLRDKVTSKGGTTEAAMEIFFKGAFSQLMEDALLAAMKRAKKLAK